MAAKERATRANETNDDVLIDAFVDLPPHVPDAGDARLAAYGYPVWIVIDALAASDHDIARVARDYEVPEDAVRAAVAFYHRHREAIDIRARANAAAVGASP